MASCKDCQKRKVGCHATCEDYIKRDQRNKERRRKNLQERYLTEVMLELENHRQKTRRKMKRSA